MILIIVPNFQRVRGGPVAKNVFEILIILQLVFYFWCLVHGREQNGIKSHCCLQIVSKFNIMMINSCFDSHLEYVVSSFKCSCSMSEVIYFHGKRKWRLVCLWYILHTMRKFKFIGYVLNLYANNSMCIASLLLCAKNVLKLEPCWV